MREWSWSDLKSFLRMIWSEMIWNFQIMIWGQKCHFFGKNFPTPGIKIFFYNITFKIVYQTPKSNLTQINKWLLEIFSKKNIKILIFFNNNFFLKMIWEWSENFRSNQISSDQIMFGKCDLIWFKITFLSNDLDLISNHHFRDLA